MHNAEFLRPYEQKSVSRKRSNAVQTRPRVGSSTRFAMLFAESSWRSRSVHTDVDAIGTTTSDLTNGLSQRPNLLREIIRKKHGHRQWQRPPEKKDGQRHHRARQLKCIRHYSDAFDDLAIHSGRQGNSRANRMAETGTDMADIRIHLSISSRFPWNAW